METTCGVFFVDRNDNVLICHASYNTPKKWTIPKGHMEEGETKEETVIRETYEETNIDLNTYDGDMIYLGKENYKSGKKKLEAFAFVYGGIVEQEIKCNSMVKEKNVIFPEIDKYAWVSLKSAKKLLHPTQILLLKKFEVLYKA